MSERRNSEGSFVQGALATYNIYYLINLIKSTFPTNLIESTFPTTMTSTNEHSTDELIQHLQAAKSQEAANKRPAAANKSSDESGHTDRILRSLREIKLSQAKAEEVARSESQGSSAEDMRSEFSSLKYGFTSPADVELSDDLIVGPNSRYEDSEGSEEFYGHKESVDTNPYSKVKPAAGYSSSESEEEYGVRVGDMVEGFDEQAYQNEEMQEDVVGIGDDNGGDREQDLYEGIVSEWGEWVGSHEGPTGLNPIVSQS